MQRKNQSRNQMCSTIELDGLDNEPGEMMGREELLVPRKQLRNTLGDGTELYTGIA